MLRTLYARHVTEELRTYIEQTSAQHPAFAQAIEDAHEFGLTIPDTMTGELLATLTAAAHARSAIIVTPAANIVGLYILKGLQDSGTLTCVDQEPEYHKRAKEAFRAAGYSLTNIRFLPSPPLTVMKRFAQDSYQLVYGEVPPVDIQAFVDAALPLLSVGGSIVLPDMLFDGTIGDHTRKDRDSVAAREADEYIRNLEHVLVTRLPLGAGMVVITKLDA